MGCDIHAHIELKVNGKWEHYNCPTIQRWYRLFERICGVRGDVELAIDKPRGIPADLNIVTELDYKRWEGDSHSATWLTKEELNELIEWAENLDPLWQHKQLGYLNGSNFLQYPESHPKEFEDVRFICWFDN